jgi:hypothetical protein
LDIRFSNTFPIIKVTNTHLEIIGEIEENLKTMLFRLCCRNVMLVEVWSSRQHLRSGHQEDWSAA